MKKPEPKETIVLDTIEVRLYTLDDYRKMDLYERSLNQFKNKQGIQVLRNRIWRLHNEVLKLCDHNAMIEKTKEEEFVKEGYRRIKPENDKDTKSTTKPKTTRRSKKRK